MENKTCERIRGLLSETLARELSPEERRSFDEHCSACPECASAYRAVNAAHALLREHRPDDDAPPDGQEASLHRRLVAEQAAREETRPAFGWRGRLLLGTAGCAFLFLLGYLTFTALPEENEEGVIVSRTTVSAKEPLTVRITYVAERPLTGVEVTVRLDDGIVFYTNDPQRRDLREYRWRGDLKEGTNEIPFVVEVREMGQRSIRTTAEFEGYRHRHDVELRADEETIRVTYLTYEKKPI